MFTKTGRRQTAQLFIGTLALTVGMGKDVTGMFVVIGMADGMDHFVH